MTPPRYRTNAAMVERTRRILEIVDELYRLNVAMTEMIRECLSELDPAEVEPWLRDVLDVDFDDPVTADFVDGEVIAAKARGKVN